MLYFSADIVFSLCQEPLKNGIVVCQNDGTIVAVIDSEKLDYTITDIKKLDGAICPGFINAHCHTELSYVKNKITKGLGLDAFIYSLTNLLKHSTESITEAIMQAEEEMISEGIVAVADICNTSDSFPVKQRSKIQYYTFIEVYGNDGRNASNNFTKAENLKKKFQQEVNNKYVSIVPHAPYSVSSELLRYIQNNYLCKNDVWSIHWLESLDEIEFFNAGSGKISDRYANWGMKNAQPFIKTAQITASILDFLPKQNPCLFVHGTYATSNDFQILQNAAVNAWWCLCPLSNRYIENQLPNLLIFKERLDHVVIGTDSLASNDSLSILNELILLQQEFSFVSTNDLLNCACRNPSVLFNFNSLGCLDKGKKPGIINIYPFDTVNNLLILDSKATRIL